MERISPDFGIYSSRIREKKVTQVMNEKMIDESKVKEAAGCLKTLAHEFRLKVMCSLVDGEKNVQQLMRVTGASQSNLSQHLAKMRDKGLLESRREANQIFYRIADMKMLEILKALHSIYCDT